MLRNISWSRTLIQKQNRNKTKSLKFSMVTGPERRGWNPPCTLCVQRSCHEVSGICLQSGACDGLHKNEGFGISVFYAAPRYQECVAVQSTASWFPNGGKYLFFSFMSSFPFPCLLFPYFLTIILLFFLYPTRLIFFANCLIIFFTPSIRFFFLFGLSHSSYYPSLFSIFSSVPIPLQLTSLSLSHSLFFLKKYNGVKCFNNDLNSCWTTVTDNKLQNCCRLQNSIFKALLEISTIIYESILLSTWQDMTLCLYFPQRDQLERYVPKYLVFSIVWSFSGDGRLKIREELGAHIKNITTIPLPSSSSPLIDYEVCKSTRCWTHLEHTEVMKVSCIIMSTIPLTRTEGSLSHELHVHTPQ